MPTTIQQGGNASTSTGPDGVTVIVQPPSIGALPAVSTTNLAAVGTSGWGAPNVVTYIGQASDISSNLGVPQVATYDLPTDLDILVRSGNNTIKAIRITDGTDTAAIFNLPDASGFATENLVVAGTFASSVPLAVVLVNGATTVTVNYTTQTSDTNLAGIAASLAAQINQSAAVIGGAPFIQQVVPSGATLPITANFQGAGGNSITIQGTGTGVTLTPSSATPLAGGAAPGSLVTFTGFYTGSYANLAQISCSIGSQYSATSPTYKITTAFPNATQEVFDNIIAYATAGDGFSSTKFIANVVAAINGAPAISPLRPASAYFTAAAGSSTVAPLLNTAINYSTAGTDGSLFAGGVTEATSKLIGNNLTVPKTGVYALSTYVMGAEFWLCGCTDLAGQAAALAAFANNENAHWIGWNPEGTSTVNAIALKQALGIASPSVSLFKDFAQYTDTYNNIIPRTISGAPFAGATYATTQIQESPANIQVQLLSGTERVGAYVQQPYDSDEVQLLEAAGINVIANPSNGGQYFSIQHNKNSLGQNDPRGNIAYSRMTMYLAQTFASGFVIGSFIGKTQSTKPGDAVRRNLKAVCDKTLTALQTGGVIEDFQTQCNLLNNSVATIQGGGLRIDILVQYLSVIDRIIVVFTGGQTVQINVQPTNLTSLPVAA